MSTVPTELSNEQSQGRRRRRASEAELDQWVARVRINPGGAKKSNRPTGGKALSAVDHDRVIAYLLAMNPADGIERPKAGPYTLEHRISVRRNAADMMLLQATTGLRMPEARSITWDDVGATSDGRMTVTVTEDVSKTHKARTVPVLNAAASAHLLSRRGPHSGPYVIGAPSKPSAQWDTSNARKATKSLYLRVADDLDIELLRTHSTHLWRTTLNTRLLDALPAEVRAAHFGHEADENRRTYTDVTAATIAAAATLGPTV